MKTKWRGSASARCALIWLVLSTTLCACGSSKSAITTPAKAPKQANESPKVAEVEKDTPEPSLADSLAAAPYYSVKCGDDQVDLGELLPRLAKKVSGVPYRRGSTDCSSMYHRLHLQLAKQCPKYVAPPKAESRAVAKRFHTAGKLVRIMDPLKSASLIKPGAVLFFGYSKNDYSKTSTEDLFQQGKGIEHIGVVVEVQKKDSQVINYHMFHGRREGKPSAVTKWHKGEHRVKKGKKYPAFGNGSQPWVAVAVMTE